MFFLKRSLTHRTLFSLSPSSSPSLYSTIFNAQRSTHAHGHLDPRNVKVSVWWDLDNCNVPSGVNMSRGAQAITAAIESSGIKGPIKMTAFGDMMRLARTDLRALTSTAGVILRHVPPDVDGHGQCGADRSLFIDLMFWVLHNPPPVHLFLITVDGGSSSILHGLRMNNYNILLATKESASGFLRSAATIGWNWDALVRGENLTGRYYNRPPNPWWYGHYEGPLAEPFTETERAAFVLEDQPGEVLQQNHEVDSE